MEVNITDKSMYPDAEKYTLSLLGNFCQKKKNA